MHSGRLATRAGWQAERRRERETHTHPVSVSPPASGMERCAAECFSAPSYDDQPRRYRIHSIGLVHRVWNKQKTRHEIRVFRDGGLKEVKAIKKDAALSPLSNHLGTSPIPHLYALPPSPPRPLQATSAQKGNIIITSSTGRANHSCHWHVVYVLYCAVPRRAGQLDLVTMRAPGCW